MIVCKDFKVTLMVSCVLDISACIAFGVAGEQVNILLEIPGLEE